MLKIFLLNVSIIIHTILNYGAINFLQLQFDNLFLLENILKNLSIPNFDLLFDMFQFVGKLMHFRPKKKGALIHHCLKVGESVDDATAYFQM